MFIVSRFIEDEVIENLRTEQDFDRINIPGLGTPSDTPNNPDLDHEDLPSYMKNAPAEPFSIHYIDNKRPPLNFTGLRQTLNFPPIGRRCRLDLLVFHPFSNCLLLPTELLLNVLKILSYTVNWLVELTKTLQLLPIKFTGLFWLVNLVSLWLLTLQCVINTCTPTVIVIFLVRPTFAQHVLSVRLNILFTISNAISTANVNRKTLRNILPKNKV